MDETTPKLLPETTPTPRRPNLLTILCILTFIGSGMNLLSSLVIAGFYDEFVILAQEFGEKFNLPGMELIMEAKPVFFLTSAIGYAIAITGAILMMKLKKTGFHIYTIAQILLILVPMYFFHMTGPSMLDIILSGTFVLLYGVNLKIMS